MKTFLRILAFTWFAIFALFCFVAAASGQPANSPIISVTTAPSGTCFAGLPNQQVISTGTQYSCGSVTAGVGTWAAIGGGSGSGTVSGQANSVIPLATAATTIGAQSALSDNGTTVSSTEPVCVGSCPSTGVSIGPLSTPTNWNFDTATAVTARTSLGAGVGTVTSVSVTSANGVSGTVATATTTPAITLALGAITPTSTNGVSAATLAFMDATSSVQTQLNGKQASGTYVTSVSVATANGVSGSSSGGATPALTLVLGAITPSSVAVNGDSAFAAGPRAFIIGNTGVQAAIVANGQYSPVKIVKAGTLENIEGTASVFSVCSPNPTLTLEDCGTSAGTCSSPSALGSVTLTAANTVTDGTITSATLTAGHYVVWETTAGTCASSSLSGSAEYRMN